MFQNAISRILSVSGEAFVISAAILLMAAAPALISVAPALAHPLHAGELGAAHGLMHQLGWGAHSSYSALLWLGDFLMLAFGLKLLCRSAKPARTLVGGSLTFGAVLGAGLLTVVGA